MRRITVILADDHAVVRQGVRALLDQENDILVMAEAGDGLQLLDLTEKLHPEVVVVDLKMAYLNGLDAAEEIRQRFPYTRIVILTMHADRAYVSRAMQAGVCGYVLKEEDIQEVCMAIRYAAHAKHYLSAGITQRLPGQELSQAFLDPVTLLTRRERQVFQLIAEGKTNSEAADLLGISVRTVEVHRAHIMEKLNLKSHIELVRFALKNGIIEDEESRHYSK